jgi:hypothetical protein
MYTIYDDLKAGRLVPVLQDWDLPALTINLAYHSRKHQPAKIRVFIDFLLARFAQQDYEHKWNEWPPAAATGGSSSGRKRAPNGAGSSDQRGTG